MEKLFKKKKKKSIWPVTGHQLHCDFISHSENNSIKDTKISPQIDKIRSNPIEYSTWKIYSFDTGKKKRFFKKEYKKKKKCSQFDLEWVTNSATQSTIH